MFLSKTIQAIFRNRESLDSKRLWLFDFDPLLNAFLIFVFCDNAFLNEQVNKSRVHIVARYLTVLINHKVYFGSKVNRASKFVRRE